MEFRSDPILSPPFFRSSQTTATPTPTPTNTQTPSSSGRIPPSPFLSPSASSPSFPNSSSSSKSSVGLSCLSPDSRSFHTLLLRDNTIVTHFLPLSDTSTHQPNPNGIHDEGVPPYHERGIDTPQNPNHPFDTHNDDDTPPLRNHAIKSITTRLPDYITELLRIDPPLELLCVDNVAPDGTYRSPPSESDPLSLSLRPYPRRKKLPLLLLYTSQSAFLLDISYPVSSSSSTTPTSPSPSDPDIPPNVPGRIDDIHEPFETHLTQHQHSHPTNGRPASIVRIRPAPNSHLYGGGVYGTLCPRAAMAMLTNTGDLVLYHGISTNTTATSSMSPAPSNPQVTVPLRIPTEELQEPDPIIDFCFLPSVPTVEQDVCSVWNALGVVLTSNTGVLSVASPIVFHGTHVVRSVVEEGVQFLTTIVNESFVDGAVGVVFEARKREARAALCFFRDVFGITPHDETENTRTRRERNHYVIANAIPDENRYMRTSASTWPTTVQGPVYTPVASVGEEDDGYGIGKDRVMCMEVIPSLPWDCHRRTRNSTTGVTEVEEEVVMGGSMVGVVLARGLSSLEYVFVPTGDSVLPRFAFESGEDKDGLDSVMVDSSYLAERIVIDEENGGGGSSGSGGGGSGSSRAMVPIEEGSLVPFQGGGGAGINGGRRVVLIPDPLDRTMVHHVSGRGVVAVSSNVASVVQEQLRGILHRGEQAAVSDSMAITTTTARRLDDGRGEMKEEKDEGSVVDTNAWSSIEVNKGVGVGGTTPVLVGVVVSGDAQLGHILVAVLSTGQTEAVNITAAQYIRKYGNAVVEENERKALLKETLLGTNGSKSLMDADEALQTMESTTPLHKLISPFVHQITAGLSGMGKIVGNSDTTPQEVTPGQVATFLSIKQHCEKDIIVPLQKLKSVVAARQEFLGEIQRHQLLQIDQLKTMLDALHERKQVTNEKKKVLTSNSELLSSRSGDVLAAARGLNPTITAAEQEYFKEVRRYSSCCTKWESAIKKLQANSEKVRRNIINGDMRCNVKLDPNHLDNCQSLLKHQDAILKQSETAVQEMESTVAKFLITSGLGNEEEKREPLVSIMDDRYSNK